MSKNTKQKIFLSFAASTALFHVPQIYAEQYYGLYPASEFTNTTGQCAECNSIPQALWYFEQEHIATPNKKNQNFDKKLQAQADVKHWAANAQQESLPSLIWTGKNDILHGTFNANASAVQNADKNVPFYPVEKIKTNLSYYNEKSRAYFANQAATLYGEYTQNGFVAHSIWPESFNLTMQNTTDQPLNNQTIADLVRENAGGAETPFKARVLWQKNAATTWQNKPVLAFVLNGAQGDDDEAHGGHFAVASGRFGEHGEWQDWLVNNFYNLGSVSEKGIIAASVPMYRYQAELNSGQSWYRPSYMLVAVLNNERSAALYQNAINRVFYHFYRQDFLYRHAGVNCAGINLETMRSLGWEIPKRGATNLPKAFAALPFKAIQDGNIEGGLKAFDYLSAEQTNLYPMVAFEAIGQDLLERITKNNTQSDFEKMLAEDLEAIIYVHIPQFPSSRAFGSAPVASLDEYMARVPKDMAQWKVVPVAPRIFPEKLLDKSAPAESLRPAIYGLIAWVLILMGMSLILYQFLKKYVQPNETNK